MSQSVRPAIPSAEELKKLPPDGGPNWNRLVFEKSPYLLQHAANPVNWYPWGEEAFKAAKEQDKPVFLSIGYSTCHWCHVMEHESFEDAEVAELMNKYFISIKVDREERPDIDSVYMSVTQALTGSGGWPMTVVLTPDKQPFYAGTYFAKHSRYGRPGMVDLIPGLGLAWKNDRLNAIKAANEITQALARMTASAPGDALTSEALENGFHQLSQSFDEELGGFGHAPKFPTPHNHSFLLRYWSRTGDAAALEMVEKTLSSMRRGGIFDQVGFGFHRYSTDQEWLVPHFEKMLYDQAMLTIACIETYQATGKKEFAQMAREILTYVMRDMTSPEGGFYSAEDADSEGVEGKFYLWTPEEVVSLLGKEEGELFCKVHNIVEGGNFREEATGHGTGGSIPHLKKPLSEVAKEMKQDEAALGLRLEASRQKLFAAREKRIHPLKDDKILTDWNGLMIAAMAKAAQALDDPHYADAARRAADFVLANLRDSNGRLLKRYRVGHAGLSAAIEDYSFMIWGLIELYEATFDVKYLEAAIKLNDIAIAHYWDNAQGGFFLTADDSEQLLVRNKEIYDGAIPSGNSVAALNLLRLGRMTANKDYEEKAFALQKAFSERIAQSPVAFTQSLVALDFALGPTQEIVIAGDASATDTLAMARLVRTRFLPRAVLLHRPTADNARIVALAPFIASQKPIGGKATGYVCENYACNVPTNSLEKLQELLPR